MNLYNILYNKCTKLNLNKFKKKHSLDRATLSTSNLFVLRESIKYLCKLKLQVPVQLYSLDIIKF